MQLDDSKINFDWYTENALNEDIDIFWTFDFAEYKLMDKNGYTYESILQRIHDTSPPSGGDLLDKNSYHIILIHDHIDTERFMPNYFKKLIDYVLASGVEFIQPKFVL